ncbi:intracellular chloride channel [Aureococcus anophagefferens]|nr:intracellular chloride channel [Aureococcus anophagefferens]
MAARYEVDDEEAPARDDDLDWESTITFMVDRDDARDAPGRREAPPALPRLRAGARMPLDQFCKLLHHDPRRARLSDDAFHSRYGYGYDAVLALRHDDDADGGRLSAKAREILDWIVPLCPAAVERRITRGAEGIKPRTLHHDPKLTPRRGPYALIHGKYDTDEGLQALYDAPRAARTSSSGRSCGSSSSSPS